MGRFVKFRLLYPAFAGFEREAADTLGEQHALLPRLAGRG